MRTASTGSTPMPDTLKPLRRGLKRRLEHALAVSILLLLTVAFFNPVFRGLAFSDVGAHQTAVYPWHAQSPVPLDTFPQSDSADLNYPWQTFISRTLRDGSFPFWDPHSFGGYPFYANGQSATLYPPRLLGAAVLSPSETHDMLSMLHVLLAGIAMYALLREFEVGLAGALLSAVAWMFSAFNMAWLHLEVVTPIIYLLPLGLLFVRRALRARTWVWTIMAGGVLGFLPFTGHMIFVGLTYLVVAVYAACLALWRGSAKETGRRIRSSRLRAISRLGAMVGLSGGVGAVVLVPTFVALFSSNRDPVPYTVLTKQFLGSASTFLLGSFSPPALPLTQQRMHEMAFAGTATAVLAVVGLFLRRPGTGLGRGIALMSILVAVGTPATWIVYHFVPGFNVFIPYSRLLVFWSFAIALLGGLGLDCVVRLLRGEGSCPLWLARTGKWFDRRFGSSLRSGAIIALAFGLIGLTAFQLISYGRNINPPFQRRSQALLYPRTPLIDAIQRTTTRGGTSWPGRIVPVRASDPAVPPVLFAAESLLFGIDSLGGYDSAIPRRTVTLLRVLEGADPDEALRSGLIGAYVPQFGSKTRLELLTRLGVTTIVAPPGGPVDTRVLAQQRGINADAVYSAADGRVLAISGAPAGPILVHRSEYADGPRAALLRFVSREFDFRKSVILERRMTPHEITDGRTDGRVVRAMRGINVNRVELVSGGPGWLVIPEGWSAGWSARVNGRETAVERANFALQAVAIPAGRSIVELKYRPEGFTAGLAMSALTVGGMLVVLGGLAVRRRIFAGREV